MIASHYSYMKITHVVIPVFLLSLVGCASTRSNSGAFGVGDPAAQLMTPSPVAATDLVNATAYSPTIRSAPISSRDTVINDIEVRLKTSEHTMEWSRNYAVQMNADERRVFGMADDAVKDAERALKRSLRVARKANESEWDEAREKLAASYEAYGAALARADAATGVTP